MTEQEQIDRLQYDLDMANGRLLVMLRHVTNYKQSRIELRRGTLEEWERANPILDEDEIGVVLDNSTYRKGDGVTPFKELPIKRKQ